jgi:hypothetical protein
MLLFLIAFDMSVKPSWVWLLLDCVLVIAAAAALHVRNGLSAQVAGAPRRRRSSVG